ncbi:hydrolase [Malassezia pachydermatis]
MLYETLISCRSGTNYSVSNTHVRYWYYYPLRDNYLGAHPDTRHCWSHERRPIQKERGEIGEWVLVDGVPSTCTNVGLYTGDALFGPDGAGPIDLVISGPNYGRNTGTAFSVSSGTLGAALSGSLCDVRSIAVSFCHFKTNPPTLDGRREGPGLTPEVFKELSILACTYTLRLCKQLWETWDQDEHVQSYSINIPIAETLRRPVVHWTRIWHSRHGQYYPLPSSGAEDWGVMPSGIEPKDLPDEDPACAYLAFHPNLVRAMEPAVIEPGTDVWAITQGAISISRLVACFEQVDAGSRPVPSCVV